MRLGRGPESSRRPQDGALGASLEELRMQDDACLLQAGQLGSVREMVLVGVVMVVVGGLVELGLVEVVEVREREETPCVPVIVVLTFLPHHYIWK